MIFDALTSIVGEALFGSRKKKVMSFSILVIMGFLVHMRNQRSNYENLRLSKLSLKDKEVSACLLRRARATWTTSSSSASSI